MSPVPVCGLERTEILERVKCLASKAKVDAHELAIGHEMGRRSDEPYLAEAHELLALLGSDDPVFQAPSWKGLGDTRQASETRNANGHRE
jgi:hypothetical protein